MLSALLGTVVEYYDYSLYGFSAGILASKFFADYQPIKGLQLAFAIYMLAYFSKPLGSLFFSRIGDKYGRKAALRISMLGMALPTAIIGLLPEGQSFSWGTAITLLVCRFLQGFFVSGEYDGVAIYMIEHLGDKYRYTASAITRATGVLGLLCGIAATNFFNSSLFPDFSWRLPFLLSAPLALLIFLFRGYLQETPDFLNAKEKNTTFSNLKTIISKQPKAFFLAILLSGSFGVTYQITIIFIKQYLPILIPASSAIISSFSIINVCLFGLAMPICGFLADKFHPFTVLRFSLILTTFTVILLITASWLQSLNLAIIACLGLSTAIAPYNALAHGVISSIFSVNERLRGTAISHALGSMLFSGTANYFCLSLMLWFDITILPLLYLLLFAIMAYVTINSIINK